MAAEDCINAIREAAGRDLSDDEIDELITELVRRRDERQRVSQLETVEESLLNAADELAKDVAAAAQIERRNALLNVKVYNDIMRLAEEADKMDDPSLAIRARTVGINQRMPGARLSADARGNALMSEYLGGLIADLRKENLLPVFNSKTLEREIARELAEVSKKNGDIGISGSDEAVRIARIVDKYRKASIARENRAGAWIRPLEGYIVRQSHDMMRIRRAGFEAWRDEILPLLDNERTFEGANTEEFLRGAYDGIVTGNHIKSDGAGETDLKFAFKGPANLAKRVSQHRVLHFKDADSWLTYNERFGRASLVEALFHDFERSARNTAMMEAFGPNPRAMFDRVLTDLKDKHRGDVKKFDRLAGRSIQNQFDEVEGITRIPVNPTSAYVTNTILAVQSMAKLGGATLSSIADIAFKAHAIAEQGGLNLLQVWGKNLSSSMEGMAPGQKRITADLIGVGLDGQIGSIVGRFTAQDDLPGMMAKLQQRFFKLNLLEPWTDGNKRGLGLMMARDLAMKKGDSWAALDGNTRDFLGLYGFTEAHWDLVRKAARTEADGREYIMPDAIRNLPDAEGVTARQSRRLKDEAEVMLRSYYVDRAELAVPTPGARERAILRQGTRPGTPMGMAVRFVAQFKAFPVTVLTKPLGRAAQADTTAQFFRHLVNGKADRLGLAHIIVASTLLGYLAQSAKELSRGKSPRDPRKSETWISAMLQGGGAGIYGDFIFGEFNRFGRSLLDTAAGPTLGGISDMAELWARFRQGEDAASGAVRFITSNTPFVNLFYTRAALDYLILFNLQESINPGYLRRMERRIKRENNQTFVLPPSSVIPRGGR